MCPKPFSEPRVLLRPGLEVDERLLKHVGRVGPPRQTAIQAQPVVVVVPDAPDYLRVGPAVADQLGRVIGFAQAHDKVTTPGGGWNTRKMASPRYSRQPATHSPEAFRSFAARSRRRVTAAIMASVSAGAVPPPRPGIVVECRSWPTGVRRPSPTAVARGPAHRLNVPRVDRWPGSCRISELSSVTSRPDRVINR